MNSGSSSGAQKRKRDRAKVLLIAGRDPSQKKLRFAGKKV